MNRNFKMETAHQKLEDYDKPDFCDFSRVLHPSDFDNDENFRSRSKSSSPVVVRKETSELYSPGTPGSATSPNNFFKHMGGSPMYGKGANKELFHKQVAESIRN